MDCFHCPNLIVGATSCPWFRVWVFRWLCRHWSALLLFTISYWAMALAESPCILWNNNGKSVCVTFIFTPDNLEVHFCGTCLVFIMSQIFITLCWLIITAAKRHNTSLGIDQQILLIIHVTRSPLGFLKHVHEVLIMLVNCWVFPFDYRPLCKNSN